MKALPALLLSIHLASAQAPLDPFGDPIVKQENDGSMDGLWSRDEGASIHLKYLFSGRYSLSRIDRASSIIKDQLVGVFRYSPPTLSERPRVAAESWLGYVKNPASSAVGFEGQNIFAQRGLNGAREVWLRQDGAKTLQGVADFSTELTDMDGTWFTNTAPVRTIKVLYRGRGFCTKFDLPSRRILNHHIFIYSFDGTVLRENIIYATEGWKRMIGTTKVSKMGWTGRGIVDQAHTNGSVERWSRVGEKPKKTKFEGQMK